MDIKKQLLIQYLEEAVQKLKKNRCELTEEQKDDLIKVFAREPMSKAQAFKFLGISRSKFDYLLRCDRLPQGRKRFGFNELVWYKDELEQYKIKMEEDKEYFKMV